MSGRGAEAAREGGEATVAELRDRIAGLDRALLESFAERVELARRIGGLKRRAGGATLDPTREAAVIRQAVETARALGLPEEPVRDIFWTLVGLCRSAQVEEP
jgi:chorismate mutase